MSNSKANIEAVALQVEIENEVMVIILAAKSFKEKHFFDWASSYKSLSDNWKLGSQFLLHKLSDLLYSLYKCSLGDSQDDFGRNFENSKNAGKKLKLSITHFFEFQNLKFYYNRFITLKLFFPICGMSKANPLINLCVIYISLV